MIHRTKPHKNAFKKSLNRDHKYGNYIGLTYVEYKNESLPDKIGPSAYKIPLLFLRVDLKERIPPLISTKVKILYYV